jgi:hypothetical protein
MAPPDQIDSSEFAPTNRARVRIQVLIPLALPLQAPFAMELRRGRSRHEGPCPEQADRFVPCVRKSLYRWRIGALSLLFQFSAALAVSRSARTMRATISGILTVGRQWSICSAFVGSPREYMISLERTRDGS